jgi:hypothetical protein
VVEHGSILELIRVYLCVTESKFEINGLIILVMGLNPPSFKQGVTKIWVAHIHIESLAVGVDDPAPGLVARPRDIGGDHGPLNVQANDSHAHADISLGISLGVSTLPPFIPEVWRWQNVTP